MRQMFQAFETQGAFQTKCVLPPVAAFLDTSLTFVKSTENEFNLKSDILWNSFVRLTNTLCK